jgi:hypothetical protein
MPAAIYLGKRVASHRVPERSIFSLFFCGILLVGVMFGCCCARRPWANCAKRSGQWCGMATSRKKMVLGCSGGNDIRSVAGG